MPKVPPVFAYVTQGRTEHLVTIIDKRVLQLLQEGKKNPSQSSESNAGCVWSWEQLDPDSKIQIQWNTTGAKQPVVVSSVQLKKVEAQEGHRCSSGGRRSSGTARGRCSSRSRLRRSSSATSTPSPATTSAMASASATAAPVPRPFKKRRVHAVVHQETNNNNNNNDNNPMMKKKEETNMILYSPPPPVLVNTSEEAEEAKKKCFDEAATAENKDETEVPKRLAAVAEHQVPAHAQAQEQAQAIEKEKAHKKEQQQQQQQRKEAEAQAQQQEGKRLATVEQQVQAHAHAHAQAIEKEKAHKKEQQQRKETEDQAQAQESKHLAAVEQQVQAQKKEQQQERNSREAAATTAAVGEKQQQQQHLVEAAAAEAPAIADKNKDKATQQQAGNERSDAGIKLRIKQRMDRQQHSQRDKKQQQQQQQEQERNSKKEAAAAAAKKKQDQERKRRVDAEAAAATFAEEQRERQSREAAATVTAAAHQEQQRLAAVANEQRVAALAVAEAKKKKDRVAAAATLKKQQERTRVVAASMAAEAKKKKDASDGAASDSDSNDEKKMVNHQQRKPPVHAHHPPPERDDDGGNIQQNKKSSTLAAVEATSVGEGAILPSQLQLQPVASQQQPHVRQSSTTTTTTTTTTSNNTSNANNTDSLKNAPRSKKRKIIRTHTVASQQQQQQRFLSSTTGNANTTTTTTSSFSVNDDKNIKSELADREVRGMESLATFIAKKEGGDKRLVDKYRCRVTILPSTGRYEVNFFNEHGKRFRSMLEVGRFLNVVDEKQGPATNRSATKRSAAATAGTGTLSNASNTNSVINVPSARKRKKYLKLDWMEMYQRLLDYKKEHDDSTKVPRNYEKIPKLGAWVAEQRKLNNNHKLLPDRFSLLESIHFEWGKGARGSNTDWMETYQRLIVYKKEHNKNSTTVPITYEKDPKLGSWVAEQRKSNNNNKLLPARFSLLESIDFDWGSGPRGPDTDWRDMYQRLVAYQKQHHTTNVPFLYQEDLKLGRWVALQRTMKFNSSKQPLHDQRCTLLDAIDFDWGKGPRGPQTEWRDMYQRLVVYQQQHHTTNVPFSYQADLKLGKWTNLQRVNYQHKNLPQERASLLDALGFEWKEKKEKAAVSKRVAVAAVPVVISQQEPILDESSNVNNDDKGDLIMV